MVKKRGVGRKQKVYFLFPYGEEAYRQKYGKYPDRARIEQIHCRYTHSEMLAGVTSRVGRPPVIRGRFDLVFGAGDDEYAVEVETGSNNNEQIYINIEKSVEAYGAAYFIVPDRRMYHALLQLCAKHHYNNKRDFRLNIALFDSFIETGAWDSYEYA